MITNLLQVVVEEVRGYNDEVTIRCYLPFYDLRVIVTAATYVPAQGVRKEDLVRELTYWHDHLSDASPLDYIQRLTRALEVFSESTKELFK